MNLDKSGNIQSYMKMDLGVFLAGEIAIWCACLGVFLLVGFTKVEKSDSEPSTENKKLG